MTTLEHLRDYVLPAAYALLPAPMASVEASALVLAIALQESRLTHRRQIGGPARGFLQFERAGVRGVLRHAASRPAIVSVLRTLQYQPEDEDAAYLAIEHNDVLAVCFGRCLLWTLPGRLPGPDEAALGWNQYLDAWQPGKPHRETWDGCYRDAWTHVLHGRTPEQVQRA